MIEPMNTDQLQKTSAASVQDIELILYLLRTEAVLSDTARRAAIEWLEWILEATRSDK